MAMITKKKTVALATVALVLLAGGAAFAYWTAGGSGTGTAATGTSSPVVVKQTSTITGLRPGGAAQRLSGNFDNTANGGPVYVTSVTVSIASVTPAAGAPAGTCDATDYTLAGATMTVSASVPDGTGVGSWGGPTTGATIVFNNKATNQDACKNATVNLAYTAI